MTHPKIVHLLYFTGIGEHLWNNFGEIYSNPWFSIKLTKAGEMVHCTRVVATQAGEPKFKPTTCKTKSGCLCLELWHECQDNNRKNSIVLFLNVQVRWS